MEKGGESVNAPTGRAGIIRAAADDGSMEKLVCCYCCLFEHW